MKKRKSNLLLAWGAGLLSYLLVGIGSSFPLKAAGLISFDSESQSLIDFVHAAGVFVVAVWAGMKAFEYLERKRLAGDE